MDMGQPQGRICGALGGNSSKTLKTNLFPPSKTSARPGVVHSTSSTPAHYARGKTIAVQRGAVVESECDCLAASCARRRPRGPDLGSRGQAVRAAPRSLQQHRVPTVTGHNRLPQF